MKRTDMPRFIKPRLATLKFRAPKGDRFALSDRNRTIFLL
jgi:hypothetical protein